MTAGPEGLGKIPHRGMAENVAYPWGVCKGLVKTAGLPERGKLCLWSREPYSTHTRWVGCWIAWSWKVDDGRRTIRVPG
ncbi:hypothetical protein JCM11754A_05240 [Isoptericola variabilis]